MAKSKIAIIFAHYSENSKIADYVVEYLRALNEISSEIYFISDSFVKPDEQIKMSYLTKESIYEPHGEYDFGSYKRGFNLIENKDQYDEILFCNDSCFAPIFCLEEMYKEMSQRNVDFWGVTKNQLSDFSSNSIDKNDNLSSTIHIQSYFFVLKKVAFLSEEFISFLQSISRQTKYFDIVTKYEIGLSKVLSSFSQDTLVPLIEYCENPTIELWDKIVCEYNCPMIKIKALNVLRVGIKDVNKLLDKVGSKYPMKLIDEQLKTTRKKWSYRVAPITNWLSSIQIVRSLYKKLRRK